MRDSYVARHADRRREFRASLAGRLGAAAVALIGPLVGLVVLASPALAFWSSAGSGIGSAPTGTLARPTGVTVPVSSSSSVPVTWTASTGSPVPTGYYVTRTGGTTVAACGSSATSLVVGPSCTDSAVPDGTYSYVVTAVYRSWTAASTSSGSITVLTATKVIFTGQPSNTVAGISITPAVAVTVESAVGVPVPTAGISVTTAIGANPGAGTLSGTASALTNSSGVATFPGLSINKAGVGYTLTAASSGLTPATSTPFTVTAAAASKFVITSTAGSAFASATANLGPISVQRQDAFGNPVNAPAGGSVVTLSSNSTGTRIFSPTSGAVAITAVTIPSGSSSATFYYGDTKAATPAITVSGSLASGSQTETITAGAATQLVFGQQPTNAAHAMVISPSITVRILDQFGNQTTSTASVVIGIAHDGSLGSTLAGTQTRTAVAGVATFNDLSITGFLGGGGTGYALQVTSTGLTPATSTAFNIT